jgi:NAD(P)H-dependent FMN reductase
MLNIAIVIGSTRPRRRGEQVAKWVEAVARRHLALTAADTSVQLVDLAEYGLPLLDEPVPALFGEYQLEHTQRWAAAIASFDGFIFVTPEYNHSAPPAIKNAIDFLFAEWNDKPAGFVSYGIHGGVRAVEHLRLTLAEVKVADVRSQVALSLYTDFDIVDPTEPGTFTPAEHHEQTLCRMLDEVVVWARALKPLRASTPDVAGAAA